MGSPIVAPAFVVTRLHGPGCQLISIVKRSQDLYKGQNNLVMNILDKLKRIGKKGKGSFWFSRRHNDLQAGVVTGEG